MVDLDKVFSSKFSLSDGLEAHSDEEPLDGSDLGFVGYELVGHGNVTNSNCGVFAGCFNGCDRVELHDKTTLDGVNHAGKVHVAKPIFHSCNRPSCPICYKYGWRIRLAKSIEAHLREASKHFGQVEHMMISVPVFDFGLSLEVMRKKVNGLLKKRGIVGGNIILHGGRYANFEEARRKGIAQGWRWGVHFHILGFILGGYSKCRHCERKWNCSAGCSGFDARAWKAFNEDGYYVKVFERRKSVFWTLAYELKHAIIKRDSVRPRVSTYFGVCARMKFTPEVRKALCPICEEPLVRLRYNGSKLNTLMLIYGGSCDVPLEEDAEWSVLEKEVVWERYVSSVSFGYGDELV